MTAAQVEEEFKELVDENWDWQVRWLRSTDFSLVFPSKESLRLAIRGGGLCLPKSKNKAIVEEALTDPLASEHLIEVWGRLYDVPGPLRKVDRLLGSTKELGAPLVVDEFSLIHPEGPVRLKFGCQAPVKLQDHLVIYVNLQGFKIRVEAEPDGKFKGAANPPPPHQDPKDPDDKGEEDEERSSDDDWRGRRRNRVGQATDEDETTALGGLEERRPQVGGAATGAGCSGGQPGAAVFCPAADPILCNLTVRLQPPGGGNHFPLHRQDSVPGPLPGTSLHDCDHKWATTPLAVCDGGNFC